MQTPALISLTASGTFFLTGLLCGVWKWRAMLTHPEHRAPFYVDTAHRAALLYSFACLVLERFATLSMLPVPVATLAVTAPIAFFAIAIATYIRLGLSNHTENQFTERNFATTTGMLLLIAGEVGGFALLFGAFVWHHLMP
jgi:hypothetical protein